MLLLIILLHFPNLNFLRIKLFSIHTLVFHYLFLSIYHVNLLKLVLQHAVLHFHLIHIIVTKISIPFSTSENTYLFMALSAEHAMLEKQFSAHAEVFNISKMSPVNSRPKIALPSTLVLIIFRHTVLTHTPLVKLLHNGKQCCTLSYLSKSRYFHSSKRFFG